MGRAGETGKKSSHADLRARRNSGDTFSFILRVHLDALSGGDMRRANFRLEDVVGQREWRFANYTGVAERLHLCVKEITNGPIHE